MVAESIPPLHVAPPPPATPRPLPEFKRYQPLAGHPDWPDLMAEARALAARFGPTLERPERAPWLWRRRLAASWTALKNFRLNRKRHRAGREDLLPLYFIWTVSRACNFTCKYCDDHRGRRYPELPKRGTLDTDEGLHLLRVMRTRTPSVYFAGGEPTVRKDLPTLTRAARDLRYYPIVVNTNGSLFHRLFEQEAWRTWLADVDILVVSLDSLDLAALGEMWVTRRPVDVIRNLLMLRELAGRMRVKLMVNTVIQPGLIDHAHHVLDLASDLGLWFCPVPLNLGPRVDATLAADAEYRQLADTIVARKRAGERIVGSLRLNERLLSGAPLNCRNTLKPHIDHDGRLAWPCKACVNTAPAWVRVNDFDHVDDLYAHASRLIDPTGFHGPGPQQCGAACNWAQNYTTDAYAHGLEHPLSLLAEAWRFAWER